MEVFVLSFGEWFVVNSFYHIVAWTSSFIGSHHFNIYSDIEKVNTVDLLQGSYVVSADGTVKPVPMIDLVGGTELAPGDILYSSSVYFNDSKSAVFNASCQYGDVEKLKVYRGSRSGSTSYSLGYFTATQGSWYGELTKSVPEGTWYFAVENGGSHNIMVDSVTVNF